MLQFALTSKWDDGTSNAVRDWNELERALVFKWKTGRFTNKTI